MVYASYNRGFKSGNFSIIPPTTPAFEPEILDAYEVGVKSTFLHGRGKFNASAFYYDYNNLQLSASLLGSFVTINAAKARIKGIEVDARLTPVSNLTFDVTASAPARTEARRVVKRV